LFQEVHMPHRPSPVVPAAYRTCAPGFGRVGLEAFFILPFGNSTLLNFCGFKILIR